MTPEETLDFLKQSVSLRTQLSLDAIFDICQEQHDQKIYDYSYSTISKLGAKRGVPKAQSIRNKTGEHYRALIQSFKDNTSLIKPIKRVNKKDSWIDDITEPKLKLLVQIQESKLSTAERTIREIIPPELEIRVYDNQQGSEHKRLNSLERDALEHLKSNSFLQKWNFTIGGHGDVIDSEGNRVFKIATIDAINKALDSL